MENCPLLTVFTPTYNLELYIEETIKSVLNQTFTDFEYLIVDDASTDNTIQIIKSINDPRIRLIKNKTNQGIAYNRNLAIKEAKGKYSTRLIRLEEFSIGGYAEICIRKPCDSKLGSVLEVLT